MCCLFEKPQSSAKRQRACTSEAAYGSIVVSVRFPALQQSSDAVPPWCPPATTQVVGVFIYYAFQEVNDDFPYPEAKKADKQE